MFLFLQRLPAWLRVQLKADDQADIRQLAARADRLFALHGHKHSESVAAAVMAEDQAGESSVNVVRRDHHGGGGADRRGGHPGSRRDGAEAEQGINKSTNGWGKKIGDLRGEEEILQLYTCQSSAENC